MSSAELRGARGFTLVEVLVSLVLAGLLAMVIFQVVRGQTRFAAVQSAQQEVQQNARGAIEIIASELRGVQPGGLVSTSANSITFMLPRAWGISCGGTGTNGATGGTALPVLFPDVPDTTVMFAINGASGLLADTAAAGAAAEAWGPVPDATTLAGRAQVNSLPAQTPALGVAGNPCIALRATAPANGLMRAVTVTGTGFPNVVPAGNTVYLYQLSRYEVGTTDSEHWIWRSQGLPGSTGSTQPLAGPLTSPTTGLVFTYFTADGTEFTPGNDRAQLALVARIGVKVVAHTRERGRTNLSDSVTTSVLLRN
ncbi:MAG TPA: prepilin-type N-terminal cleavage/methylation domain-containing protein [Longimicrobium sp.]|jgi:prepilin-type N-terminal cleavage/methylation domain-containing protein